MTSIKTDNPCNNLSENSDAYIQSLYKSGFHQVRGMVLQNSGTADDARDVFQEALMVLYQKCREGNFNLLSNINTYLYSIAHYKWLNELRRIKKLDNESNAIATVVEENDDDDTRKQRQRLLATYILKLGDKCQNIIHLYFEGKEGESIAKELQFSSYEYYRLAKKRCIDTLKEMMKKDKLYKELKD